MLLWPLDTGCHHNFLKPQNQWIIELLKQDYLPVLAESFLVDSKSQGPPPETIRFYKKKIGLSSDIILVHICAEQACSDLILGKSFTAS